MIMNQREILEKIQIERYLSHRSMYGYNTTINLYIKLHETPIEELIQEAQEKITNPDIEHGQIEYENIILKFSFKPLK